MVGAALQERGGGKAARQTTGPAAKLGAPKRMQVGQAAKLTHQLEPARWTLKSTSVQPNRSRSTRAASAHRSMISTANAGKARRGKEGTRSAISKTGVCVWYGDGSVCVWGGPCSSRCRICSGSCPQQAANSRACHAGKVPHPKNSAAAAWRALGARRPALVALSRPGGRTAQRCQPAPE